MSNFNWNLISNYKSMENLVTEEERIGKGANGVVII